MKTLLAILVFQSGVVGGVPGVEMVKRAIVAYIHEHLPPEIDSVTVEFRSIPKLPGSLKSVQIAAGASVALRQIVTLPVELQSEGENHRTVLVSVKLHLFGTANVLARTLQGRTRLTRGDLTRRVVELFSTQTVWLVPESALTEYRTTRMIKAGTVLRQDMVEPLPWVERGKPVTLRVRSARVTVSTSAVASTDGWPGQPIWVQKNPSRERIRATVVEKGTVQISLPQ